MQFDDNFIRRMNDNEYQIALAQYLDELCEEENKKIEEECNKNPFLKNRLQKAKNQINSLSSEQFADFMSTAIQKNVERIADKIEEFNRKWDKEHYKVIYHKFK